MSYIDKSMGLDIDDINVEIQEGLNKTYALITKNISFKINLLIYRLVKRGLARTVDIANCLGTTTQNVYRIIEDTEKFLTNREEVKHE